MNKYRLINQLDEHNEYECLKCKNTFICYSDPVNGNIKCCGNCFTIWDGEFTKRNKRYKEKPKNYYFTKYPRLVIETRSIINYRLSNLGFFAEKLFKPEKQNGIYIPIAN